jgi:hypothetical protein
VARILSVSSFYCVSLIIVKSVFLEEIAAAKGDDSLGGGGVSLRC